MNELRKISLVCIEKQGRRFDCGESRCSVVIDAGTLERRDTVEEYFQEISNDLLNKTGDGGLNLTVLSDKGIDDVGGPDDTVTMTT